MPLFRRKDSDKVEDMKPGEVGDVPEDQRQGLDELAPLFSGFPAEEHGEPEPPAEGG